MCIKLPNIGQDLEAFLEGRWPGGRYLGGRHRVPRSLAMPHDLWGHQDYESYWQRHITEQEVNAVHTLAALMWLRWSQMTITF
jgi:hypothetical protein